MAGKHALLAPSGFKALMLCPAKPAMERGLPDDSSEYADEGTAAHFLGAECLTAKNSADHAIGQTIQVGYRAEDEFDGACWMDESVGAELMNVRTYVKVDADFAEHVQVYVDLVRARMQMYAQLGAAVELHVEQAVPIGHITGEQDAEGTADTIIIAVFPQGHALIEVIDLKFGRGVEVSADDNPQLKLYGLGAAQKFGLLYDIRTVSTAISQPRICREPSEAAYSLADLEAWARDVAAPAAEYATRVYRLTLGAEDFCNPHEDACRFCKAKGTCPALAAKVQEAMGREFTDLTTADEVEREAIVQTCVATADAAGDLGARMDAVELVEMWCKAIRGRVEKHLLEGKAVAGWKLVAGKKGNRAWSDAAAAETLLRKTFRLKVEDAYELKLISPTAAEKVLKNTPKRWAKAQALITQPDGKPSVAPISDKRPALEIQPMAAEFTPITEPAATADDLV